MKNFNFLIVFFMTFFSPIVFADEATDACTVVLCLATGTMPNECEAPVRNYLERFAEEPWNAGDFLNLCQMGSSPDVPNARLIGQAYGHCDAVNLNSVTEYRTVNGEAITIHHRSVKPNYCTEYEAMVAKSGGAPTKQAHFVLLPPYKFCTYNSGVRSCHMVTPPVDAGHWED